MIDTAVVARSMTGTCSPAHALLKGQSSVIGSWHGEIRHPPDPSREPTAYTISLGWKTNELERLMNGDSASLGGGTVRTEDVVERAFDVVSECTAALCVLQLVAVTVEVL